MSNKNNDWIMRFCERQTEKCRARGIPDDIRIALYTIWRDKDKDDAIRIVNTIGKADRLINIPPEHFDAVRQACAEALSVFVEGDDTV